MSELATTEFGLRRPWPSWCGRLDDTEFTVVDLAGIVLTVSTTNDDTAPPAAMTDEGFRQ